jgi:serine/threonine-protein kinase HipA
MVNSAKVSLWGIQIAAVSWDDIQGYANFQYTPKFAKSRIEIAPLMMPLSADRIYNFPALSRETFQGLPGLLADSIPDKFGQAVIDAWLLLSGQPKGSMNPVEKLCYIGMRGMGALEFHPNKGPKKTKSSKIHIDQMVQMATEVLAQRQGVLVNLDDDKAMQEILDIGTSAGGARAKAIIAWNEKTNEVKSGQVKADPGFTYWILKFDGVSNNKDKGQFADPQGYGLVEFAYHKMALEAGITMSKCRIFEENGRHHFMTKRFDRDDFGEKILMQTLGGIAHLDYNQPSANTYEHAFQVMNKLEFPMVMVEEQFRRMVFNIVARNQDDHVKNIAYLMHQTGKWELSPAYDVTYACDPSNKWLNQHQMSMNGKRDGFSLEDFDESAKRISLRRGLAREIIEEVQNAVRKWKDIASEVGVESDKIHKIEKTHRFFKL